MSDRPTALERAFQLAESGHVVGITDIVKTLKHEHYAAEQLLGRSLRRQLKGLIKASILERTGTPLKGRIR